MKIYAKQVPPEYQESPLFWDETGLEGIELFGNRHLRQHTSALFDRLPGMLDELAAVWDNMRNGSGSGLTWAEELTDIAPPVNREAYTREERRTAWPKILRRYIDASSLDNSFLCDTLQLITGRAWDWCTLRGCCQADWQECIYPADDWDGERLERLEAEYFNTGSEWIIHDDQDAPSSPEEIDGYSVYCTGWNDDQIRQEIADAAGVKPDEVTLYKFTGYARRAKYEEVI